MSHIDDGRLNALLDGELEAAEASEVRAHIATCADCAKRLEAARRFLSEAATLLGALELPAALSAPAPARRVSKTAKEVAIDIDGATHQSPAIRANLPETVPRGIPSAPRRFDFTTLAWAATIVLAVGVGYLANEARHARQRLVIGEDSAARTAVKIPEMEAARRSRTDRPGVAPSPSAVKSGAAPQRRAAPAVRSAPSTANLARKPTQAPAGKTLAQGAIPPRRRRTTPAAAAATGLGAVTSGAGARAAEPAAPPAARAEDRLAAANVPIAVTGVAAPRGPLSAFRRATLEEAVARLDGTIRLIDGLSAEQVEVGPGRLVPGADRGSDLVRVIYYAPGGLRLELDQQRLGAWAPAGGRRGFLSSDVGMRPGDTLTTAAPNGQVRVRWIDRTFWMSLTGNLPPDSLRRLVERVR